MALERVDQPLQTHFFDYLSVFERAFDFDLQIKADLNHIPTATAAANSNQMLQPSIYNYGPCFVKHGSNVLPVVHSCQGPI